MARSDMNKEGMTFEEWVCAAGLAKFDWYGIIGDGLKALPYSSSEEKIVETDGRQKVCDLIIPKFKIVRRTTTFYSRKIRNAWRNGEDPTEWRAAG